MMLSVAFVRWRAGERKFDAENAAVAGRAGRFDATVMGGANGSDNRESEARTTQFARARFIDAIKSFKNARQRFRGNPHAIIGYFEKSFAVVSAHVQTDGSALGRIFNGVVEKIDDDLLHPRAIALYPHVIRGSTGNFDVFVLAKQRHLVSCRRRQFS